MIHAQEHRMKAKNFESENGNKAKRRRKTSSKVYIMIFKLWETIYSRCILVNKAREHLQVYVK